MKLLSPCTCLLLPRSLSLVCPPSALHRAWLTQSRLDTLHPYLAAGDGSIPISARASFPNLWPGVVLHLRRIHPRSQFEHYEWHRPCPQDDERDHYHSNSELSHS